MIVRQNCVRRNSKHVCKQSIKYSRNDSKPGPAQGRLPNTSQEGGGRHYRLFLPVKQTEFILPTKNLAIVCERGSKLIKQMSAKSETHFSAIYVYRYAVKVRTTYKLLILQFDDRDRVSRFGLVCSRLQNTSLATQLKGKHIFLVIYI